MTTILEKVARGIYRESYRRCCNGELPDGNDQSWRSYLGEAHAALEALREPSEGMVEAGCDYINNEASWRSAREECAYPCHIRPTFEAMIDAALAEQPTEGNG